MKDDCIKDHGWWEEYFAPDGGWERNGGRLQTRMFAEHFTDRIQLDPTSEFSILDAGCALGDAIRHFAKVYPHATLYGIDFSTTAIQRSKNELGNMARFSIGTLEDIDGHYDIIYCSNTFEHFPDFDIKARQLIRHCNRLCILVPFEELGADGKPLVCDSSQHHQHTFSLDSFYFLVKEGMANSIKTHVFSCPGAWGWTFSTRIMQEIKNIVRVLLNRPRRLPPMQIFFDIIVAKQESELIQIEPKEAQFSKP
jgi:SAM-dependent methyltransferase